MTLRLNGSSSGHTEIKAPAAAGSNTITLPTSNGSAEQFLKNSGTAGELEFSNMVETSTGVGINQSSPSYELQVSQSGSGADIAATSNVTSGTASRFILGNSAGTARATFNLTGGGSETAYLGTEGSFPLYFQTNGAERLRIDSSGRLLHGHSTSRTVYGIQAGVQIEGTQFEDSSLSITCNNASDTPILLLARSRGSSLGSHTALNDGQTIGEISFVPSDGTNYGAASVRIQAVADDNHATNDVPGRFIIQVVPDGSESSSERFRLGQDGRMRVTGVYDETTGGSANVNVQSDGLLQRSVSSIKYKKDVETLEDSYADALLELRPVWYRSKCNSDNPNHGHWGFVAEELAEIDPRLVIWKNTEISWDENGFAVETSCDPEPEGVQYERFVPHLLNLIKRQKATITEQQAQIDDLLARVTALEAA